MPKTRSRPKVRGVLLQSRVAFVQQHDASAFEFVLGQLGSGDVSVLRGPVNADAWHDRTLLDRVDHAIAYAFADHERADVLVHLGRTAAEASFARRTECGLGRSAPDAFLEAVPRLYASLWTEGKWEFHRLRTDQGIVRLRHRAVAPDGCWHELGWIQRGLELCGATVASVLEISCSAGGGSCCEYFCEWACATEHVEGERMRMRRPAVQGRRPIRR